MDGSTISPNEQIRTFLETRFPLVASQNLADGVSLLESGAVDSLGLLDIVGFLEEEMGVALDDDDMTPENFDSISAMTNFVEQKRG